MTKQPTVSFLIPTLNSARVLKGCLESITSQDYPDSKIEIIIADGGSTDKTLEIAGKYKVRVFPNPLKTAEAGKVVALREARGELVALVDSDNHLPTKNWLKKMVIPFAEPEIIGSEPWKYTYRKKDGFIDRYSALLGMNDPYCHFVKNYDRLNTLTGKWTGLSVKQKDHDGWIGITLEKGSLPTIGANGTIMRRRILMESKVVGDYLVDIDVIADLIVKEPVMFAKVKVGIIHLFCGDSISKFIQKQQRRVKDFYYFQNKGQRVYDWQSQNKNGIFKFVFACVTIAPLLYQVLRGYFKKPDKAWFFHPLACWLTLWIYSWVTITGQLKASPMDRNKYGQ